MAKENKFKKALTSNPEKSRLMQALSDENDGEEKEEEKRLNVRAPLSLYNAFSEKAKRKGHTITWLILGYMKSYVSEDE